MAEKIDFSEIKTQGVEIPQPDGTTRVEEDVWAFYDKLVEGLKAVDAVPDSAEGAEVIRRVCGWPTLASGKPTLTTKQATFIFVKVREFRHEDSLLKKLYGGSNSASTSQPPQTAP